MWAPDLIFYNGKYYIYYSVCAQPAKHAPCVIGLYTTPTLDSTAPGYKLTDAGGGSMALGGGGNGGDPNARGGTVSSAGGSPSVAGSAGIGSVVAGASSDGNTDAHTDSGCSVASVGSAGSVGTKSG